MAGKGKGSKTKIKDSKKGKTSSQTSGTTIKDEIHENQETEQSIETAPESIDIPESENIEITPEPPKLDPVTSLYPFLINSWSGECVEGVPHGFGRCEFKSGTVYTGNITYGLMHGKGEIRLSNGFHYKGDFYKNSLEGHGHITFPDDSEYEGSVVDGLRHGQGHFTQGNVTYTGGWKCGVRHGTGIMRYSQTSFYDGQFIDGKENGYGLRQWDNLDVYKGNYKNGKRHGHGHLIMRNNQEEYEGEWIEGVQNGFGINTSIINDRKTIYTGHWLNGKRHGKGHIEYSDGSILEGHFENGRKIGTFNVQKSTGEEVKTKFDNDRSSPSNEQFDELENFNSLTEKELISTFGDSLAGGKEAIVRNIARCREIYIRYSKTFMDRKFRLIHFDKLFLDYEISHMMPVTKLYPDDNCNPLSFVLFRQFAYYLVNASRVLWPDDEIDSSIQFLFDKYLNKPPSNDNGILLSDECRDFIPHFFVIWENCDYKMTARHLLQLIKKLQLPFKPKDAIEIMSEYDVRIPENIEREISFIQFAEAMIKLIIRYKENVVIEKNDKMVPLMESEVTIAAQTSSGENINAGSKIDLTKVISQNTVSDVKCDSDASTRASGSLLQTISNLSDNEEATIGKNPSTDMLNRGEIYTFFNENVLNKWLEWKKILEITKEEKIEKIYDISGLIVSSKTTINSAISENTL